MLTSYRTTKHAPGNDVLERFGAELVKAEVDGGGEDAVLAGFRVSSANNTYHLGRYIYGLASDWVA